MMRRKEAIMKKRIAISLAVPTLMALCACNLSAGGNDPTIDWEFLQDTPTVEPQGGVPESTSADTPTPQDVVPTATIQPTDTPAGIDRLPPGTEIDILHIEMIDGSTGWGIGGPRSSGSRGRVFRTVDGGTSWQEVTPPESADGGAPPDTLSAIGHFADDRNGWVTYHALQPGAVPAQPVVWWTADGGHSWTAGQPLNTVDFAETYFASHLVFADAANGWVMVHLGAGMNHDYIALYRTNDGGATWSRVADPEGNPTVQSCSKTGIAFSDGLHGWMTGDCHGVRTGAFLFRTDDGGVHWEAADLPAPEEVPGLFTDFRYVCSVNAPFLTDESAFFGVECVDWDSEGDGNLRYLYRSEAGGTFSSQPYPGGDIFALDGSRVWALSKEIHHSDDGGASWTKVSTVTWDGQFDFVTAQTGWAAVRKGDEYGLVRTDDGGVIWIQLTTVVAAEA
jgi:photosystem II stability/assembly factor-like uncharacterized protein